MSYTIHKSSKSRSSYLLPLTSSFFSLITKILSPISYLLSLLWKILSLTSYFLPHKFRRKLNPTQRLFLNVVVAGIFIVFGVWIYTSFINPQQTQAAWFNDSWQYRQTIPLTNGGTDQREFQVLVTLDTSTLIAAGKLQSDCDDIRFTSQDGKPLPYFQATACDAAKTRYWVKVLHIPTGSSNMFVYYGNTSAKAASNRDAVFDLNLMGTFTQTFTDTQIAPNHGLTSDRDTNFFISHSTYINRFNDNWVYQQNYTGLDIYTGVCYDDKRDLFYGIDWSSKQWSAFSTSFVEQAPMDQTLGDEPIDCATDSTYLYTNHRNGKIKRNAIADNTSSSFNMDALSGFNWGGQGLTYAFGYLIAGTTGSYGANGNRIYVIDISNWSNPRIVTWWSSAGHTLTEVAGLTWKGKYIYQTDRNNDTASEWSGPVKRAATEPTVGDATNEEHSPAPIGYWSMDEGNGNTVYDLTSSGNNGTISGATWKPESECKVGKCLYFDGTNDQVNFGNINTTASVSGNLTVSFWLKPTNLSKGRQNPLGKAYGGEFDFTLETSGAVSYYHGAAGTNGAPYTATNANAIPQNEWTHLVFTRDTAARTVKVYVNGKYQRTHSYTSTYDPVASTRSFRFGYEYTGYYQGYLDEVAIYSTTKTDDEIKSFYAAGMAGTHIGGKGTGGVLGSANQSSLNNGLVGYWKMDESSWNGTPGEVIDSSGTGNNGTATSATIDSAGKFGKSGSFTSAYIDAGTSTTLNPTKVTVAAWVKADTTGVHARIIEKSYTTSYYLGLNADGTHFKGIFANSSAPYGTLESTTTIATGVWYHVVITHDGETDRLYVNGKLEATQANTATLNSSNALNIGRYPSGTSYWDGNIDEARIYNRALSPSEVSELYNYAPRPVAYYDFNEGLGTTLHDNSGNGNDSTSFSGNTTWTQGKYGGALTFDGTGDYVRINQPITTASDATVSFWLKIPQQSSNYKRIFEDSTNGISVYFTSNGTNGLYGTFGNGTSGWTMQSPNLTDNQWHYITLIGDSTTGQVRSYLDGKLQSSRSNSYTSITLDDLYIGSAVGGANYFLHGSLDDVKIYNYVRTPGQIVQDMNGGHPLGGSPVGSQTLWLKFNEGVGSTTYNEGSGGNFVGTLQPGAGGTNTSATQMWTNDGKLGKGIEFDGTDDYISLSDDSSLDIGTGDKSWTFWYKTSSSSRNIIYRKSDGSNANGVLIDLNGLTTGQLRCYITKSTTVTVTSSITTLNDGSWHYGACVLDRTSNLLLLYSDGELVGSVNSSGIVASDNLNATSDLQIGQGGGYYFTGGIDEFKIYSAALSADEVKIDYNQNSALTLGALSTESDGKTPSNSSSRANCIPGDTANCSPPLAEWTLNEARGSTANDTSGNGNTGTLNGSPRWDLNCKIGACLKFNSSDVSSSTGPNPTTAGTIEAWVKVNAWGTSYDSIVFKGPGLSWSDIDFGLFRDNTNQRFLGTINNGTNNMSGSGPKTPTINPGQWYHLVFTWDSSQAIIYTNGVPSTPVAWSNAAGNRSSNLRIGRAVNGSSYPFIGWIDNVKIYDYARTPAQVAWDYNKGKPIAHWDFDECQGPTAHDIISGNHGTITIGATGSQTSVGTCQTTSSAWGNGATGKFNSSLNFDGTDDYVNMSQPSSLQLTSSFTLSAWIKTTETSQGGIVTKWYNTPGNRSYRFILNNGTLSLNVSSDGTAVSTSSYAGGLNDGNWHFVTGVYDASGTNAKLYVDGVLKTTTTGFPSSIYNNSQNFNIGPSDSGTTGVNTFTGQIDDVQVFNYALNQTQIRSVMNQNGAVRFGPSQGTP